MDDTTQPNVIEMSADLVAAYVSNNRVSPHELPGLLAQVHGAFASLTNGTSAQVEETPVEKLTPAQIRKSIKPNALISFVDGKAYKTLKRHLGTNGLDPHSYRQRYGLPNDYPMVAPSYSAARSAMAKSLGLGQVRQQVDPEPVPPAKTDKPKSKRAARSRKAAEPA